MALQPQFALSADLPVSNVRTVLSFKAYDGGAYATQFLRQVGTRPCGKTLYVAGGVTPANPHLHALTSDS